MDYNTFVTNIVEEASRKTIENSTALQYALENCCTIDGWVAEFGVWRGSTISVIRKYTPKHLPVLGFDCFTGLPEDWQPTYPKGAFTNNGKVPDIDDNVAVVKGLFKDSLPPMMLLFEGKPARLIHIDCDLYEGANDVLTYTEKCIVPGTVLAFDELLCYPGFEKHEIKAFYEFIQRTGYYFDVVCATGEQVVVVFK